MKVQIQKMYIIEINTKYVNNQMILLLDVKQMKIALLLVDKMDPCINIVYHISA